MTQLIMEGLPEGGSSSTPASLTRKVTIINEWLNVIKTVILSAVGIAMVVVLLHLNRTLTAFDATLVSVNGEVKAVDNTRKSLDDLMVQGTILITDADTAASNETAFFAVANTKLSVALDNVNSFVTQATTDEHDLATHSVQLIDASKDTITGAQPVLAGLKANLDVFSTDLKTIQVVLADPEIPATIKSLHETADQSADTMKHIAGTTSDVQGAVHSYLHPTWPQKVWSNVKDIGLTALHFFL